MDKRSLENQALRRYVMIDPLVSQELEPGQKSALLRELSDTHGVSISTLKRYLKRYESEGPEGLMRCTRNDAGQSRRLPGAAIERAAQLRKELPSRSTPVIIRMLEHEHPEWQGKVKRSTLDDHFRRLGLNRSVLKRDRTPRRRFSKTRRNALWQTDMCIPQVWVQEGEQKHQAVLIAIIDDATRFCVGAEFYTSQETWVVENTLRKAIIRNGVPNALYLDNGAQFCAKQISGACAKLLIDHRRAPVGDGASKGKVERWFRTFQEGFVPELATRTLLPTLTELNRQLWAWIEQHYHQSTHRELKNTPTQCWNEDTTPLRRIDLITLESAFQLCENRVVDKTGLVSLHGQRYIVDKVDPRVRVEVRYHPRDLGQIQIWLKDEFIQVAFPYEVPLHSPRSREERAAKKAATAASSLPTTSYLDQLELEYDHKLASERDAILSGPPPPPKASVFHETDFIRLLKDVLDCTITPQDEAQIRYVWRTCGGLSLQTTQTTLAQAIVQWGKARHLSVYLDAISQAHRPLGSKEANPRV